MKFRNFFRYISIVCFIAYSSASNAYPISAALSELPNKKYALVVGDYHLEHDLDSSYANMFAKLCKQDFATTIVEGSKYEEEFLLDQKDWTASAHNGCLQALTDSALIQIYEGNSNYILSDCRHPALTVLFAIEEALSMLDDIFLEDTDEEYHKKTGYFLSKPSLIKKSMIGKYPEIMLSYTKQNMIDDLQQTLEQFQKEQQKLNPQHFDQLLVDIQSYITTLQNLFADHNAQSVLDWALEYCKKHQSLNALADLISKHNWFVSLADAGLIIEVHKSLKHNENIILYVGNDHAEVVNHYLKHELHANMQSERKNQNNQPISIDELNAICCEFKQCCAQ